MLKPPTGAKLITAPSRMSLLAGAALLLVGPRAHATEWFVDGLKGQTKNTGAVSSPFKETWQAVQKAKPGDTIWLLPTVVYPHLSLSLSGSSGKSITISGAGLPPNRTKVIGDNGNFAAWVNGNYLIIKNFDLSASGGTRSALHVAENHHHITIANNVAHDSGGNGISTVGDDYVTIRNNIVYGNARNTSNDVYGSGISTLGNIDVDNSTAIKMRIDSNIVYLNTNTPNCKTSACLKTAANSDGNGIIIDDLRRVQRDSIPYRGRTLVSNNVVFGNGGRGIHVYLSDHVTVTGNTTYFNNQDPYEGSWHPGEIMVIYSGDVAVYNNIMMSDGGMGRDNGKVTSTHVPMSISYNSGGGQVVSRYNLCYSPQNNQVMSFGRGNSIPVTISDNLWGDPMFARPSLDPRNVDFRLQPGSPALGAADLATSMAADILSASRAGAASIGAYEEPAVTSERVAGR